MRAVHPIDPADSFHSRTIVGTMLGLVLGAINNFVLTTSGDPFLLPSLAWIPGALVSGLVAGAIQGAFIRAHIRRKPMWLGSTVFGWLLIGIPYSIPTTPDLGLWACDNAVRWAVIGGVSGITVAGMQSFFAWHRAHITLVWVMWNMGIWASLWALPVVLFGSLMRGEGSCGW